MATGALTDLNRIFRTDLSRKARVPLELRSLSWKAPAKFLCSKHLLVIPLFAAVLTVNTTGILITAIILDSHLAHVHTRHLKAWACLQLQSVLKQHCLHVGGGLKRYAALEVANTLFRVTFRLKNLRLAESIMKGVTHNLSPDSATPFQTFPRSQQVTYKFFEGRIAIFNELYVSPHWSCIDLTDNEIDSFCGGRLAGGACRDPHVHGSIALLSYGAFSAMFHRLHC